MPIDYSYTINKIKSDRAEIVYEREDYPPKRDSVRFTPGTTTTELQAAIEAQAPVQFWQGVDAETDNTLRDLNTLVGRSFPATTP